MDTIIAIIALTISAAAAGALIANVTIDAIAAMSYRRTIQRRLRALGQ